MNEQEYIDAPPLGRVILNLIKLNLAFKDEFKTVASSIAADIESASVNQNCSCRDKVLAFVTLNRQAIGSFLYNFVNTNNISTQVEELFSAASKITGQSATGRVAKTSITNWPDFAKGLNESGFTFKHMSTSIVGDDVYVFFL